MRQRLVAAIDQGTTSTRCILFDRQGRMVSIAQREHRRWFPRPGWVEHDATEIFGIVRRILPQAIADAGAEPADVVALGITNQRETVVIWDRATGIPVHRAIVWQDNRAADQLAPIAQAMPADEIRARSGLPLSTYFSGPKVRWLLENGPGLAERAARGELLFGTMDTWLLWNLTGGAGGSDTVHATDPSNASRTMLMDLRTLGWDEGLTAAMSVPRTMLPNIHPTIATHGITVDPVPGIPVTAMIGDQQAALFGQTAFEAGEAKCTFGTGGFLLLNTGTTLVHSSHQLITTVAMKAAGSPAIYALEGSIPMAGGLVQWFRDNLGLIRTPAEIETLAAAVPDNGGCYVVPAFSGLFAPYWDPHAQGMIVGLTSYVTRHHIARAALEATAWQTRDLLEAMAQDAPTPVQTLIVDGGMTSNNLLMQTVADVLGLPVVRPKTAETVALGAAYAAGIGVGYWPSLQHLRDNWQRAAAWKPSISAARRHQEHAAWRHAVGLAHQWGLAREKSAHPDGA